MDKNGKIWHKLYEYINKNIIKYVVHNDNAIQAF